MKKAFRLILATALCGLALTSCTQDLQVDDPVLSSAKGTRIINAAFASATKTVLGEDGLTPYFENGDQILVSNSEESETCSIVVSGDKAWFSTNLVGELTAAYPASAAQTVDKLLKGNKTGVCRFGLFKDANICGATISEGSETATFENLTALLKVVLPAATKSFSIDYVICEDNTVTSGIIEVEKQTDVLYTYYVALAPGKLERLYFSTDSEQKDFPLGLIEDDGFLAGTMYTVNETGWIPRYALPGKFSVSGTKQVHFSEGNLQAYYDGTAYNWGFASSQYGYIGNAKGNTSIDSQTKGAGVDLFGWSTASTNYGISTSEDDADYAGYFVDWGKNIGDGNTWRTLRLDEWKYLFETRTNASSLYKYGVSVCGKTNCLVIAPDNWDASANPLQGSYDALSWPAAEAAGLVCLPAAGYRAGSKYVGTYASYWSSSAYEVNGAYEVDFDFGNLFPAYGGLRKNGNSVRLITECK